MSEQHIWILEGKWAGMGKYAQVYIAESAETIKAYLNIWHPGLRWYKNHSYEMSRYKDESGTPHTYRISKRDVLTMTDVNYILERKAKCQIAHETGTPGSG